MKYIKFISIIVSTLSLSLFAQGEDEDYFQLAQEYKQEEQELLAIKKSEADKLLEDKIFRQKTINLTKEAICHSEKTLDKINCAEDPELRDCISWNAEIKRLTKEINSFSSYKTEEKEVLLQLKEKNEQRIAEVKAKMEKLSCYTRCPVLKERSREECNNM